MIDKEIRFRSKITFTQFLLSVGVVYQHTIWNYRESAILNAGQEFLFYLFETCVPFFFMISGYLFFRTYEPSKAKTKILSRGRTLLIPYLIWNAIYTVFIIGFTKLGFIHNAEIESSIGGVLLQFLNAEFSPLWFIKYLMIFTVISPFAYYLLRGKISGVIMILVMLTLNVGFYYSGMMQIPLNVNSNSVIMLNYQYIFYALGAYSALNWKEIVEIPTQKKRNVASILLLILIVFYFLFITKHSNVIIGHSFRLLYIIVLWFVLDYIPTYIVHRWMYNSFFLYCSHLIVLQCVQRVCDMIIIKISRIQSGGYVLEYIFLPIIVIAFLMIVAECMKKYLPKIYNIFSGGRG